MKTKKRKARPNATGRNDHQQFLKLFYDMAQSEACRSLSGPALKVWLELRCRFNGRNNGDLSLSLDQASCLLGIGKATAQRAFKELEQKGFIKMVELGQWYGRKATTWQVTDCSYQGHPPSNEWGLWRRPRKPKKADSRF